MFSMSSLPTWQTAKGKIFFLSPWSLVICLDFSHLNHSSWSFIFTAVISELIFIITSSSRSLSLPLFAWFGEITESSVENLLVLKLKRVVKALFSKFSFTLFSMGSKSSSLAVSVGFMICLPTLLTCKGITFCRSVCFYYRFNSVLSFE